jgi:hypothetical protein
MPLVLAYCKTDCISIYIFFYAVARCAVCKLVILLKFVN